MLYLSGSCFPAINFPAVQERAIVFMNFALDILLVCIVIVFVIVGVKRGFIKSAAHFLGAIAAACLSAALGGMAAQWLYDTLFHDCLLYTSRCV